MSTETGALWGSTGGWPEQLKDSELKQLQQRSRTRQHRDEGIHRGMSTLPSAG